MPAMPDSMRPCATCSGSYANLLLAYMHACKKGHIESAESMLYVFVAGLHHVQQLYLPTDNYVRAVQAKQQLQSCTAILIHSCLAFTCIPMFTLYDCM